MKLGSGSCVDGDVFGAFGIPLLPPSAFRLPTVVSFRYESRERERGREARRLHKVRSRFPSFLRERLRRTGKGGGGTLEIVPIGGCVE